jgi:regulator of sigma E protease
MLPSSVQPTFWLIEVIILFDGFSLQAFCVQSFAVFVMLAILSILIIVHEFGHFSVARFFGFQTPVFGFGLPFGPHWVVGHKWGTEFRVHACLLGGYVAIPELGDESSSNQEAFGLPLKACRKFPIWQRALVAFAGVGFNIMFAYLVMLTMFMSLGQPTQATMVHSLIKENPIAKQAGILAGDQILTVDTIKVTSPTEAVKLLTSHKSEPVAVEILRDGKSQTISMVTNADGKVGMALFSKGPIIYQKVDGGPFNLAKQAAIKLWTLTFSMIDALNQMVSGLVTGSKGSGGQPAIGLQDIHGVLAVVKIGADIARQDWSQLFLFTIMISMDLAIINLLPWPALDGGHLAFMAFEAVRGRPMGERAQGQIVKLGFISLIFLMAVIMVNDITALFTGKLDIKMNSEKSGAKGSTKESKGLSGQSNESQSTIDQNAASQSVPKDLPANNPAQAAH